MDLRFGLTSETIASIQKVFASFPEIGTVFIYGSRVKGNYRKGSDIDLALQPSKHQLLDLTLQFQIEEALEELLLPYMLDISIMENIDNPELLSHISRVGQVFYQRGEACLG